MKIKAGNRNKFIQFLKKAPSQEDIYGTQGGTWSMYAEEWAEVEDVLPSRSESISGLTDSGGKGINISKRPARIRIPYRDDLNSSMRIKIEGEGFEGSDRMLRIISGPAEIDFHHGLEFIAEELSTEGEE